MTVFDYVVLAVIVISLLFGLWRGFVSEVLAIVAWFAAFYAARYAAPAVAPRFAGLVEDSSLQYIAGFAAMFIAVLILFSAGRYVVSRLVRAAGLAATDRLLGVFFGAARGMLVALTAVMLGGMTQLPRESWWRNATTAPAMEAMVMAARPMLPPIVAERIRFR